MTNEEQARAIANSKVKLRKRFAEARSVMTNEYQRIFKDATLDFERKRLVSKDGRFYMQWTTREYPDQPESYHNQQTSVGCVIVYESIIVGTERFQEYVKEKVEKFFEGAEEVLIEE